MEDLIGIGVANAAEKTGIGECAFESVVFGSENASEGLKIYELTETLLIIDPFVRIQMSLSLTAPPHPGCPRGDPRVGLLNKQLHAAGIETVQARFAFHDMQVSTSLSAGFGQ